MVNFTGLRIRVLAAKVSDFFYYILNRKKLKKAKLENNVNVVFNSNKEQYCLINWMRWGMIKFVSFWYYYICIPSRSSHTEVFFFKKVFLKISQDLH